MDLDLVQKNLKNRIINEVPIMVKLLAEANPHKSPTVEQIWDNARTYGEAIIAEVKEAYPGYEHNLCKNAMAEADQMLSDRGPLISSYSAALWSLLRYRPDRA